MRSPAVSLPRRLLPPRHQHHAPARWPFDVRPHRAEELPRLRNRRKPAVHVERGNCRVQPARKSRKALSGFTRRARLVPQEQCVRVAGCAHATRIPQENVQRSTETHDSALHVAFFCASPPGACGRGTKIRRSYAQPTKACACVQPTCGHPRSQHFLRMARARPGALARCTA
jgi:hypothetical protein